MKTLGIAFGIMLVISGTLFFIFRAFGVGTHAAGPLATGSLTLFTFIHSKVETMLKGGSRVSPGIVPLKSYEIPRPLMILYATLTIIGILEFANILYAVPIAILAASLRSSADIDTVLQLMISTLGFVSIPAVCWGVFLVGRWTGIRSGRSGYWIICVAMCLARGLDWIAGYFSSSTIRGFFKSFSGNRHSLLIEGLVLLLMIALLTLVGMLGVWRGKKIRFGAYFNSLLKQLPDSTRGTLLQIAFEEASSRNGAVPAV